MCEECYSDENRITPLLNPLDCLENHTQYICGTCGRCICIEHDPNRGLQRWNFRKITTFLHRVQQFLFKAMNRRGCRRAYTWNGFVEMLKYYPLAKPKTYYCLY